ncbi:protein kinase domain-containing protein [Streptosporangium sp. CA-115845]|uniref:protein kinase domain-containing protein n=1 Tax=Streptosporangium sp. CA-115845 TaxID=3240071 RepID=UPI003D8F324A
MGDFHPLLAEDPERIGVHVLVGRLLSDPKHAVYLGHPLDDDTLRVIRMLEPYPDADPQTRERITHELYAAKRVPGAHTVRLLEVGWFDDSPYVVREHVEGRTLREAVAADGPLSEDALERLAVSTLTALTSVHLIGLVHGGLTPDTVLLGPDGPRICDIGLGGTGVEPDYLAPERIRAELASGGEAAQASGTVPIRVPSSAGRPADLFSWASTIVHAATGQPPFGGRPEAVLEAPANLTGVPSQLRPLIAACLDKSPEARPDAKVAMMRLLGDQAADQVMPIPRHPSEDGTGVPDTNPGPGDGATHPPATRLWNAPPLPGGPPPVAGAVITSPVGEKRKTGGLPLMLVAGVGVVALLSGTGIWAAGNYASLGDAGRAADARNAGSPLALAGQWQGQEQGQGAGGDPTNRVTVPWGTTPEPEVGDTGDVGPLRLPTDTPTEPMLSPLISPPASVPAIPTAVPTAPPAAPSTTPAAPSTTPSPTKKADTRKTPTAQASKPGRTSRPSATPTPERPAPKPTAQPTTTQEEPKETRAPKPTTKPTTAAPRPTKTTAPPAPKPTKTTAPPAARPTAEQPAAAPPAAKPTTAPPKAAPQAASRSNPYSAQQVCGAGYYVQRSSSFGGGTTYQLYNTSTGSNCVVTIKSADVGVSTQIWATLEVQNGGSHTDRGNYEYYAGPVYLPARGKCVRFSGGGPGGSTSQDWANCG